jgi:hypothetical protein
MPNAPLIAVDTNVLIDFADEDETVADCFSTVRKKFGNPPIVVLPTVIGELADISQNGEVLATEALKSIVPIWGFKPINYVPVGHGIVEQTALKIRAAGLLPEEEINDSFIIAEAALANVTLLLSSDSHLKDIDQTALKIILDDCEVGIPIIFSPWKIVRDFYNSVH